MAWDMTQGGVSSLGQGAPLGRERFFSIQLPVSRYRKLPVKEDFIFTGQRLHSIQFWRSQNRLNDQTGGRLKAVNGCRLVRLDTRQTAFAWALFCSGGKDDLMVDDLHVPRQGERERNGNSQLKWSSA